METESKAGWLLTCMTGCALAWAGGASAQTAANAGPSAFAPRDDMAHVASLDTAADSLSKALGEGRALVVVPMLSDTRARRRIEGVSPTALEVLWEKVGDPRTQFGMNRDADLVLKLDEDFAVYAIKPGTYRLAASGYFTITHENSRGYGLLKQIADDGVGMVVLEDRKDWTWVDNGQRWVPPQTMPGVVETSYCSLVVAGSNNCVSWSSERHVEDRVVEDGRWERDSKREEIDALAAMPSISAKTPFATVKIAPGELLLLDAFVPSNFAATYDENACVRLSADKVSCSMSSISYDFHPVLADRVSAQLARLDNDKLKQLLAKIQYRPYSIAAESGADKNSGVKYYYLMTEQRKQALKKMFEN
ncbi:hypothetical protein [Lysobacter capsici]|uniref:hypothetical protein n=1 Tax=Lysobacter capsici TaxID=435897 RepID=UPI001C005539|nr:hypothetical protein [Lysobacter capsici]QWF18889.1 hypothetical protein KME82_09190 [Lysobacter capsici]